MEPKKLTRQERIGKWRAIIEDFKSSGLSQSEYAVKHNLEPKYISKYHNKFNKEKIVKSNTFISVDLAYQNISNFKLNFKDGINLEIPNNCNINFLEKILKLLKD